ncbi:MAG: hypothetical protein QOE75_2159 [Solirubrobacterales bacterium]|jgi:hypothetical protein|nr:hypothetical protein [Solirubrobacterales bacterium]
MSLIQANGNGGRYPYFFCIGRMKGTGCKQPYVPVDLIETAVEEAYGEVAIPTEQAEQDRLSTETAQAERHLEAPDASFGDIAATLDKALDLLADCHGVYRAAPGHLRRQWTKRCSSAWSPTTSASPTPRSPSPSRLSPIRGFRLGWMVRPSPEPALLLAAVQMRSF